MNWCGDYPEDFTTVCVYFSTHDGNGAPVAPLTAFEAGDVSIYKNGSNAQKTSTNGVTMTSPFDSIVGLHCIVIDTSNDTGDTGFWTTGGGSVYTVLLNPDTETVNSQVALKVIGTFGIKLTGNTPQTGDNYARSGAANIAKTGAAIGRGTVTTGGSTTSIPTSAFSPAGAVADQFKNRVVLFDADTTTATLRGQAATISASSNSSTPTFTIAAMTTAPASGDTFSVL